MVIPLWRQCEVWCGSSQTINNADRADRVDQNKLDCNPKMETFRSSSDDLQYSFLRDFSRRSFLNHLCLWLKARILWYFDQKTCQMQSPHACQSSFRGVCEIQCISKPARGPPSERSFHRHRGVGPV